MEFLTAAVMGLIIGATAVVGALAMFMVIEFFDDNN
jgi:hypothetical protein